MEARGDRLDDGARLWIAHLYSHALAESIDLDRRLTAGELCALARRERGILVAAVLPCAALVIGAMGVSRRKPRSGSLSVSGWGRSRRKAFATPGSSGSAARPIAAIVGNILLGSFVVLLKVLVSH